MMDETTIATAVLRTPRQLLVVLNRRREPFEPPSPEPVDTAGGEHAPPPTAAGPYVESFVSIAAAPATLVPQRDELLRAWDILARAVTSSQDVRDALALVLRSSVPAPYSSTAPSTAYQPWNGEVGRDVDPKQLPQQSAAMARTKRTAAHPRGYRGTKHKPPTPPRSAPVDLRDFVCSIRGLAALDAWLGGDTLVETWRTLQTDCPPTTWPWLGFVDSAKPTAAFVRQLLHIHWALELTSNEALRIAATRLWATVPASTALVWLRAVADVQAERRARFLELILESEATETMPTTEQLAILIHMNHESPPSIWDYRVGHAISSLAVSGDLHFVDAGYRLANRFAPDHRFVALDGPGNVEAPIRAFTERTLGAQDMSSRFLALTLWERCAVLPGLDGVLELPQWSAFSVDDRAWLVRALSGVIYHELDDDTLRAKWQFVVGAADGILAHLASVRARYREKAFRYLDEILWSWHEPQELRRNLTRVSTLIERLAAPPFLVGGFGHVAIDAMLHLDDERWTRVAAAPDPIFKRLESACLRSNDACLIGIGLGTLAETWPALVAEGFTREVRRLLTLAKTLGCVSKPFRKRLLDDARSHPLVALEPGDLETDVLVDLIDRHRPANTINPVPRVLRDHFAGERTLSARQISRHHGVIETHTLALKLEVIRESTITRLAETTGLTTSDPATRHAVLFEHTTEDHRRALRRMLSAVASGDAPSHAHPASRRWLEGHPRIDIDLWHAGFTMRCELAVEGMLTLAVETSPLETLRMGSYVGSCLGLGGDFTYSAAAVTLDVNKQVIYARTQARGVVARQLVAISEADELVCFEVYPLSVSSNVRQLFRDYDRALAEGLGIDIHAPDPEEDPPEIAHIRSQTWWYEEIWNLEIDDTEGRPSALQ